MILHGPVAVTGAGGRVGRALMAELGRRGAPAIGWSRPDFDLDDPRSAAGLVARDEPQTVFHAAAWTDVDGCARDPVLAHQRNATAAGELAAACANAGVRMLLVSTNEVFDGARNDGRGYLETDEVRPVNEYGASKLAGEEAARDAFAQSGREDLLRIARTAWLYGPPGNDFPTKIIAAADRLEPGSALRVVSDEFGSPTYTVDLARALVELVELTPAGVYHLTAAGHASRYEVAQEVLGRCRPGTAMEPTSQSDFQRVSSPPPWGVLDCSRAASYGITLRDWHEALAEYLSSIC